MANKKIFKLVLAAIIIIGITAACDKKEDDNNGNGGNTDNNDPRVITATNVIGGNSSIAKVVAIIGNENSGYEKSDNSGIIVSTPYQNGSFQLTLPESLEVQYLEAIDNYNACGGGYNAAISDANAKGYLLEGFTALDVKDNPIGFLMYCENMDTEESPITMCYWVYVDRDVTITGNKHSENESIWDIVHDVKLKKGWNRLYECWVIGASAYNSYAGEVTGQITITYTTQKPSYANLKWYFFSEETPTTSQTPIITFGATSPTIIGNQTFPYAINLEVTVEAEGKINTTTVNRYDNGTLNNVISEKLTKNINGDHNQTYFKFTIVDEILATEIMEGDIKYEIIILDKEDNKTTNNFIYKY